MPSDLRRRLDAVLRDAAFACLLGVEVVEWEPGTARTRFTPGADQTNVHGSVHGAALFALADAAFEVACNGYGRVAVGLDVSVHYAAVAEAGQVLVADAVEVTRSKRVASYRVDVSAADGRTRCSALAVAFRTDHWHLGVEAWPAQWRERY